ncbi:hypothetical protein Glove_346g3 [Diversispora epigaea]|uniref:Uncharacterized protein n=1 Tax=Diversispora epigaea TaxID=1348612 RepID=A0A397HJ51_9GLOM|nr:hypothetical protein Glove_346g3 [Diversispora epigaea]
MLSYIDRNVTDNKETWQRAFNVKLFNNELPTLEKLKDRFPKIYENDSCIRCNLEKEDQQDDDRSMWDTCKNMCKTLEALKELHIPRDVSTRDADHLLFIDVMLGLIPITVYDIVLQKVVTHESANQIIDDVFNQFKLFLHTHIWKDRCTTVKKWETENGISNNKWKKKVRNETLDTTVTSQTNNTDNNSVLNNTTQDLYIIMLSKIAVIIHVPKIDFGFLSNNASDSNASNNTENEMANAIIDYLEDNLHNHTSFQIDPFYGDGIQDPLQWMIYFEKIAHKWYNEIIVNDIANWVTWRARFVKKYLIKGLLPHITSLVTIQTSATLAATLKLVQAYEEGLDMVNKIKPRKQKRKKKVVESLDKEEEEEEEKKKLKKTVFKKKKKETKVTFDPAYNLNNLTKKFKKMQLNLIQKMKKLIMQVNQQSNYCNRSQGNNHDNFSQNNWNNRNN